MTQQNPEPESTSAQLKRWIEDNDKNQAFVAKNLGLSGTVLSQYLGGKYPGDNAGIDKQVKAFLDLQQARAARKKIVTPFLLTSVAKKIQETAAHVHEDGIQGILVSPPGYGKTTALQQYASQNQDVIYLEVNMAYNALGFFQKIHKHEFGDTGYKGLLSMQDDIIDKLRGSGRMIIVDQAEYLPHKALEMVRSINDWAKIGVLYAGLERLLENIRGLQGQYAQMRDRIGAVVKLSPITLEDARLIVYSMIGEKRAEKVFASFHKRSHANARYLVKMVNAAVRIAHINDCHINEDVIAAAEEMVRV